MKKILITLFCLGAISLPMLAQDAKEVLTITKEGNVGINQTDPNAALDINGDVLLSGRIADIPKTFFESIIVNTDFDTYKATLENLKAGDHVILANTGSATVTITNVPKIGELLTGECCELIWDGTNWFLLSTPPSTAWPVGITYTQYPGQLSPVDLNLPGDWEFEETTALYAGDFFRAEGGNANAFDGDRQGDAIRNITGSITGISLQFLFDGKADGVFTKSNGKESMIGHDISPLAIGNKNGQVTLDLTGKVPTANENRPVNQTIRIWKRTS